MRTIKKRIPNTPDAIIKYSIVSTLNGLGCGRGYWTRVYFENRFFHGLTAEGMKKYHRVYIGDTPMESREAREYIASHGYVEVARDPDTVIYAAPDGSFRDYARKVDAIIPDDIGARIISKNTE